jgi:hypothetical protein
MENKSLMVTGPARENVRPMAAFGLSSARGEKASRAGSGLRPTGEAGLAAPGSGRGYATPAPVAAAARRLPMANCRLRSRMDEAQHA